MREYDMHQATTCQMAFAGSPIAWLVANWKARRVIRQLDQYDDFMLLDIGLTRGDLRHAASLPITTNPMSALRT
jgi:uncharacterized protein YjiS (DUF1127 family)